MSATEETAPGKVWICPGCGARYAEPTVCVNEHPPVAADEYDLAPGDDPAPTEPPAETAAVTESVETETPETEPTEPEPAPVAPQDVRPTADQGLVENALHEFDAAYTLLKTKLGL